MNKIFNEARMAYYGQVLSTKEMLTLLADMPNSKNGLFLTVLVKHNAIKRISKGQYMFAPEPVHHSILEAAMNELRARQNEYGRTYNNKKKKQPIAEEKSDIQKAIDLLLSTGDYEIFKIEKIVTVKKTQL